MYELTEFNNGLKGYKISWKELETILDTIVPESVLEKGWYENWYCNNWEKEINGVKYNRTYLSQKSFRNRELRKERKLGYYDNIEEAYIITDRRCNILDVVKLYLERNCEN